MFKAGEGCNQIPAVDYSHWECSPSMVSISDEFNKADQRNKHK